MKVALGPAKWVKHVDYKNQAHLAREQPAANRCTAFKDFDCVHI